MNQLSAQPEAAEPRKVSTVKRDAIIFMPGLFRGQVNQSIDNVCRRIAAALNRQAVTGKAAFVLSEGKDEDYEGNKTRMITISRKDGQQETAAIDVYEMNYEQSLTGQYKKRSAILQSLAIGALLASNFGKLLGAIKKPSKSFSQKWHVLYAGFLFMVLAAYMIVLLVTAVLTVNEQVKANLNRGEGAGAGDTTAVAAGINRAGRDSLQSGTRDVSQTSRGGTTPGWLRFLQMGVIVITALGLFTKTDLKQILSIVSAEATCAINYLNLGERSGVLAGQLSSLLEHIFQKSGNGTPYRDVHIMAYSFGSILAMDTLFPHNQPGERYRHINTLITIGNPFDFIRTYWPAYFNQRAAWKEAPRKWLNIYAAADVLGSDFIDEMNSERKEQGVELATGDPKRPQSIRFGKARGLKEYSLLEKITLIGFKIHAFYWEGEQPYDVNCFDLIVKEMYAGDSILK